MSFNLIDLIKDQLSDQVMEYIANLVDGDSEQVSTAVNSAIPGLLSGLLNLGSDQGAAKNIVNVIKDQDEGILEDLTGLLGGDESRGAMLEAGSRLLGSLFGNSGLGKLSEAIGGFSGIGNKSSQSLLGMLAPLVFSVIKRKLLDDGTLNLSSLMKLFTDQKENIEVAMPSGFDKQLQASGFSSQFSKNIKEVSEDVGETVEEVSSAGAAWFARVVPLLILLGVIWFAYNQFIKDEIEIPESALPELKTPAVDLSAKQVPPVVANQANEIPPTVADSIPVLTLPKTNVKEELDVILGSVTSTVGNITDVASAKQALSQLTVASDKLSGLSDLVASLPETAKEPIKQIVAGAVPGIKGSLDKAYAIPGVGPIIQPIADSLLQKLALFE
ncbi:MAG: DUF937 domain-containing protein [Gammaproteobacteria bacterium]|nr:DUF937 domain-containing protein [Gammaproteobacteria bacterium]